MTPGGLVEVRVSWPGHPRYLKKIIIKKNNENERTSKAHILDKKMRMGEENNGDERKSKAHVLNRERND